MKAGWPIKMLGEVCENLDSKRIPITKNKRIAGKYPYYGASGVVDYVDDYLFDENLLLVSEDGANLLVRTYPIAFSVSGKAWVNNHAHVLKFPNLVSQHFIEFYLNSLPLDSFVNGMAQPKLNQKSLNSIPVPAPPLPEQKRIVEILDDAFVGIATAKANAEQNLLNARALFDSHLNSIFTHPVKGWVQTKLENALDVQPRNGWSPPAANHSESGIPVLTLSSVTGFQFRPDKIKYTSAKADPRGHYWVKNGDFLITRSNTPELVGHIAIAKGITEPTIYPDLIMRMVPAPATISTKFLYYQMRTHSLRQEITGRAQGANPTMKKISKGAVQSLPIGVPSLSVQKKIVGTLDALSKESQRLESIYQQKLAALDELKKSLLHQAFSGSL